MSWSGFHSRIDVLLLFALMAVISLSVRLLNLPLNRIIELRCCNDFYRQHDRSLFDSHGNIPERFCKIDEVQKKLAWLGSLIDISLVVCGESSLCSNDAIY